MNTFRSTLQSGSQFLASHLRRLCQALNTLGDRLRHGIASAAGETAAQAVQEAVGTLLNQPGSRAYTPWQTRQLPHRDDPWREQNRDPWSDREEFDDRPWHDRLDDPDDQDQENDDLPDQQPSRPRPWLTALSLGLQAAGLWLRCAGRFPVLPTAVCGLLTALAAWVFGPLAASAAGLLSLAALILLGPDTVSAFARR